MKNMDLLERVVRAIQDCDLFKCKRKGNIVEVLVCGMKMFNIYENGFIATNEKSSNNQFYKLFDIVSKERADMFLDFSLNN